MSSIVAMVGVFESSTGGDEAVRAVCADAEAVEVVSSESDPVGISNEGVLAMRDEGGNGEA